MNTEHLQTERSPETPSEAEVPSGAIYDRRGGEGYLSFHGTVDIFEAQKVYAAALHALSDTEATATILNFTAAERLDLSALQILAALKRDLEAAGRPVSLQMPEPLATALTRTGLTL